MPQFFIPKTTNSDEICWLLKPRTTEGPRTREGLKIQNADPWRRTDAYFAIISRKQDHEDV